MRLIVEKARLARGDRTILDEVSFEVAGGSALILTGPNGAGKTTLLRTLAGFLPLAAGSIELEGGLPETSIAEQSHWIGHHDAVKRTLTVEENLRFWADYLAGDRGGVASALEAMALAPLRDAPAAYLSAGQRRRLGLARLLVANRPIWLLDEPTTSLDKASVALLLRVMARHLVDGGILIAATHADVDLPGARHLPLGIAR